MTTTIEDAPASPRRRVTDAPNLRAAALEAVAILAAPVVLYVVLRLRGMAPAKLPDPAIHTSFIIDPHDIFARYQAAFDPSSRLREAARVGFLVPARIAYLLFGAVPGFFAFRYVLALVAIVPLYLLLRKLYGRWAGFVGIAVVMSSPVIVTAWGTDYPDSATVSFLTGGFAAFALSWGAGQRRLIWLGVGAALLTMAVWSLAFSIPLVIVMVLVYVGVRLQRQRADLGRDLALLVAGAISVTTLLAICSKLLLGPFDFITPTVKAALTLSRASYVRADHSASWSWAQYDAYLLVPLAIAAAYVVIFARRLRTIETTQLFIGLAGLLQLGAFAYLQFFGSVQALEMHYFSSVLWSSVDVMLAIALAGVTRPILRVGAGTSGDRSTAPRRVVGWIAAAVPGLLVIGVALAYEGLYAAGVHVPAMTWMPWGVALAAIVVAGALVGRRTIDQATPPGDERRAAGLAPRLVSAGAAVVIVGAALVLTVAPRAPHRNLANAVYDPPPAYDKALGGNDTAYVAEYTVVSQLPGFVGHAAYPGEILLTWEPNGQFGLLLAPMGMYHNSITWVSKSFPVLRRDGVHQIRFWRAAQVLLMSLTGRHFAQAVHSLARFQPRVVRRAILSDGWYHLHAWLVDLRRYIRRPRGNPFSAAEEPYPHATCSRRICVTPGIQSHSVYPHAKGIKRH